MALSFSVGTDVTGISTEIIESMYIELNDQRDFPFEGRIKVDKSIQGMVYTIPAQGSTEMEAGSFYGSVPSALLEDQLRSTTLQLFHKNVPVSIILDGLSPMSKLSDTMEKLIQAEKRLKTRIYLDAAKGNVQIKKSLINDVSVSQQTITAEEDGVISGDAPPYSLAQDDYGFTHDAVISMIANHTLTNNSTLMGKRGMLIITPQEYGDLIRQKDSTASAGVTNYALYRNFDDITQPNQMLIDGYEVIQVGTYVSGTGLTVLDFDSILEFHTGDGVYDLIRKLVIVSPDSVDSVHSEHLFSVRISDTNHQVWNVQNHANLAAIRQAGEKVITQSIRRRLTTTQGDKLKADKRIQYVEV